MERLKKGGGTSARCQYHGCGRQQCDHHCRCVHCQGACRRKPVGATSLRNEYQCEHCTGMRCQRTTESCRREGCGAVLPCPEHCQCRACPACPRPPVGDAHYRMGFTAQCNQCGKGACAVKKAGRGQSEPGPVKRISNPRLARDQQEPLNFRAPKVKVMAWAAAPASATSNALQAQVLAKLCPRSRIPYDGLTNIRLRAGEHDYPVGLAVDGPTNKVIAIAMQPYLMKGRGRLRLPLHCDENALDSMRAAYSFLLLHQKVLERCGGVSMLHDLASRQHDMWIDDPWACVGTNGASAGALSALAMLQELTNCGFNNEVAITGEVSLSGRIWAVQELEIKLQGAARLGLSKAVMPQLLPGQQPVQGSQPGVEVVHVDDIFQAKSHMVIGFKGDKLQSERSAGRRLAEDLVVVRMAMDDCEGQTWTRDVEMAVIPGTGQIHVTGARNAAVKNTVAVALACLGKNWPCILAMMPKAPAKRVDLELMCRVGEDGTDTGTDTLDLHVNFAGYYYPVNDCSSTLALVLGFLALSLGIDFPTDTVTVCGHVNSCGLVSPVVHLTRDVLEEAARAGMRKFIIPFGSRQEVETSRPGSPANKRQKTELELPEVVPVDTLLQCLEEVFPAICEPPRS